MAAGSQQALRPDVTPDGTRWHPGWHPGTPDVHPGTPDVHPGQTPLQSPCRGLQARCRCRGAPHTHHPGYPTRPYPRVPHHPRAPVPPVRATAPAVRASAPEAPYGSVSSRPRILVSREQTPGITDSVDRAGVAIPIVGHSSLGVPKPY